MEFMLCASMDVDLSSQHDELIAGLYELRNRMNQMSRDERLIVEMAIQMVEYLDEYAADVSIEEDLTKDELRRVRERVGGSTQRIRNTMDRR